MADGDKFSGGDGDQNVCSFIASFFHQRESMERLLNWLRQSQTTCTDSNCFDDLSGLPGTEIGSRMSYPTNPNQENTSDQFAPLIWLFIGLFTLMALNLSRGRNRVPDAEKKNFSSNGPDGDGFAGFRRTDNNDDDDHDRRPAV